MFSTHSIARSLGLQDGRFTLTFAYDPRVHGAVRQLPGRRYDPDRRLWTVPVWPAAAAPLRAFAEAHDFTLTPEAEAELQRLEVRQADKMAHRRELVGRRVAEYRLSPERLDAVMSRFARLEHRFAPGLRGEFPTAQPDGLCQAGERPMP